uniref:Uncharacterized protein n=1 Tax=Rhizophora mucronata TaxID=61149 RepID=A0A2P2P4I9_RHIMU
MGRLQQQQMWYCCVCSGQLSSNFWFTELSVAGYHVRQILTLNLSNVFWL